MNTIVILIDSLNFHCLEPYGATHVHTPNLQRFARRAHVFDNHFIGSAPCMPARRELFTGRQEFLWRGWGFIEPWDRHLAVDAARAGAVTQMITDHYHYWEGGAHGYFEPFQGVEFIRGHENDMWRTDPLPDTPEWVKGITRGRPGPMRGYRSWGEAFYANARQWRQESDFPCAQVMGRSADWLQRNQSHEKFMLWVEAFDPHEPHYLPEPYRSMYVSGKPAPDFDCWPPYQDDQAAREFISRASDDELAWIRAQYYGKVTMVDRWLGEVLDRMDALDLWKNTAVIITTDHGHDLCYNRLDGPTIWGKSYPHPESHARIPLMVWHPDYPGDGQRVGALTCAVDVPGSWRDGGAPESRPLWNPWRWRHHIDERMDLCQGRARREAHGLVQHRGHACIAGDDRRSLYPRRSDSAMAHPVHNPQQPGLPLETSAIYPHPGKRHRAIPDPGRSDDASTPGCCRSRARTT